MLAAAVLLLPLLGCVHAQLTAQSSVAPELRECYMNVSLVNRNNLAATNIATLIDIIQKIEDHPNVNVDLRQLAVLLLHTYRQDGIEYHQPDPTVATSANVLPFAPTFHSYYRHRLLLTKLIPNNLQVLGNETINHEIKCSLHNMLSTTVDARLRNNEGNCYQLSQYRSLRTPRDLSSINDDVEILDDSVLKSANKNGHMKQYDPNNDVEYNNYAAGSRSERQVLGDSQCPILTGVISTQWGAVSAGNLIAGIAAGAESQRVALSELVKGSVLTGNYNNLQQYVTTIYPATLSGDLAEAALIQGTERGSATISIGATGGFNSTVGRRFFMLQSRVNIEMTDPEIRGDIDGFVLGTNLPSLLSTFSSLKLSQLLDMYYSPRNGIYNPHFRACNRRSLAQEYISYENLLAETNAFAVALDTNMPLRGTITGGLSDLVTNAVTNFQTYVANNLQDVTCYTTETNEDNLYRIKTNLYIIIDAAWQYDVVYPAVSELIESMEVGKYGSSVTLLSAFDGSIVVNTTYSPSDFHSQYTITRHQAIMLGVSLETVYANLRTLMTNQLDHERTINYIGGNTTTLLFLLNTGNLQNNEQVWEHARFLNDSVPDLNVLYATSANQQNNLYNLVRDMHRDIMTVSLTTGGINIDTSLAVLEQRLRSFGRRIANPVCGSEWNTGALSGSRQFDEFVEPGYINYYTIRPNYFFHNNDNRKVRITRTGTGVGSFVICHSRVVEKPSQNSTLNLGVDEHEITCQTLTGSGNVEISLANACNNAWTINTCQPFYISVKSDYNGVTSAVCTDTNACRFPYNIRYTVTIEDFGCFSGGISIYGNIFMISLSLLYVMFRSL